MADVSKNKAMAEALALWGRVCGRHGQCTDCPIGQIRGANVTCQDFARQFPEKMLSILKEMDKDDLTYYGEFCIRFPDCNIQVEEMALVACRRAIFEGYVDCAVQLDPNNPDYNPCVDCWKEKYVGDVDLDKFKNQDSQDEEPLF